MADVLGRLWGGPETLVVVSSDLSHFHDHETARRIDRSTAEAITSLQPERLDGDRACGWRPLAGLLTVAKRKGLGVRAVDLRSSGDTTGPLDRVVGYGAFVVEEADGGVFPPV
jgi:AmmeMemoRadiSam system protein B